MYHYFINPASTTTSTNALQHLDGLEIELMLIDAFKERGAFDPWHDEIESTFLQRFYLSTLYTIFIRFSYIPDIFPTMKKSILQLFPNYKKNPYIMKWNDPLLQLLEIDRELHPEDLAVIRDAFLSHYN